MKCQHCERECEPGTDRCPDCGRRLATVVLEVLRGDAAAEIFPLGTSDVSIGRSLDNDLCLADSSVSRVHAKLIVNEGRFEIADLESTRGVIVNGNQVQRVVLQPGDVIALGDVTLRFSPAEEPQAGTDSAAAVEVLLSVIETINATHVLTDVLDQVIDAVMRLTGAERGFLYLAEGREPGQEDPDPEAFRKAGLCQRAARFASSGPRSAADEVGISHSVLKLVMDRGQTVATGNAAAEPSLRPFESVTNLSLRTIVCVPLRPPGGATSGGQRRPIGVLYVDNSALSPRFRPEALRAAEALAVHAALAIENARLFESEQKTIAELQQARDQAQEASRAKSAFLANMSHELHTPLNAILNYAELLKEKAEDQAADEFLPDLRRIVSSGKHLLRLIDDVLDLARLEEGRMRLAARSFEPSRLLREIVTGLSALAAEHENSLELAIPEDLGEMESDPRRFRQLVSSVVSNALKFTEKGQVVVAASRESAPEGARLRVSVRDTGMGIAPQMAARLFEAFAQSDDSDTRRHGGLGLGLAIASRLAERLGGRIEVETEEGQGSHFQILIPVELPERE